ncbi:MAG: ABC transporter permease [Pyrobaculum sp.]
MELLRLAWRALWERKGRTVGAIIGVVIAFTALSFSLTLGQTYRDAVVEFFTSSFRVNTLFVTGIPFTEGDVAALSSIRGVTAAIPMATARGVAITPGGTQTSVTVLGVSPALLDRLMAQTVLHQGEMFITSTFVLVGHLVAFDSSTGRQVVTVNSPLSLMVGRKSAEVMASGILSAGNIGFFDTSRAVVMDISLFRQLTGVSTYSVILVELQDLTYEKAVSREIRARFPNVEVLSPQALMQTLDTFFAGMQLFLGTIAGVSTVITALWLYDTMSISTIQRTKEIGIMRALGFRRRQIMAMFLGEALIIAMIGVAVGVAVLAALMGVLNLTGWQTFGPRGTSLNLTPSIHPEIAAVTALLVVLVNLAGAFLPAYRASRINVVEALRYE